MEQGRGNLDPWQAALDQLGEELAARNSGKHRAGLLVHYWHRSSTCPPEGTNDAMETMKRQAYGICNEESFQFEISTTHETKCSLGG